MWLVDEYCENDGHLCENEHYSEAIAAEIKAELDLATQPWGVVVERVEVKDVSVPEQLQRSLASAAEAEREARAKVCELLRNQKIFEHLIKLCLMCAGDRSGGRAAGQQGAGPRRQDRGGLSPGAPGALLSCQ